MSLVSDPPSCALPASGGIATHQLVNSGAERIVFKVKSSNNNEYRIKQVYGFVEPFGASPLDITRISGPPKEDKLVIYYGTAPADSTDATAAFSAIAATPAGSITIFLSAERKRTSVVYCQSSSSESYSDAGSSTSEANSDWRNVGSSEGEQSIDSYLLPDVASTSSSSMSAKWRKSYPRKKRKLRENCDSGTDLSVSYYEETEHNTSKEILVNKTGISDSQSMVVRISRERSPLKNLKTKESTQGSKNEREIRKRIKKEPRNDRYSTVGNPSVHGCDSWDDSEDYVPPVKASVTIVRQRIRLKRGCRSIFKESPLDEYEPVSSLREPQLLEMCPKLPIEPKIINESSKKIGGTSNVEFTPTPSQHQ